MTETETSPAAPRTRAHDHKQLAAVLEWPAVHVDKAVVLGGILPDYGRPKTSRWSGPQVDDIETRRDEIAAGLDVSLLLDDDEMMTLLGLKWPDWTRGREHGIIPGPDRGRFWTRQLAADLAAKSEELREQIPPQPLGAFRCADLMKELSGIDTVTIDDFDMLVEQGHVECVDYWKQYALYDTGKVKQLATTDDGKALIAGLVADRVAWTENSVPLKTALRWLEWERRDFERTARELGIKEGRFARWAREDIARMAADEELAERVRRDRLLGPEQSAEHMEIRRTDFNYVVAAGWVRARAHAVKEVGRYKEVDIPLYATGDLEDALQIRGVPWEDVRAVKPGEESPLREYTRLPRKRADVIHAFCGEIRDRWSVETWPHYWSGPDKWQIDWEQSSDGHPAKKEVAALLSAHPGASRYRADIELATEVGDVIRTARACLEPGAAVILDTETTDLGGVAVEVAVIDAATGATLLDTLISPDGVPVEPGARAVHGISDRELEGAPMWRDVLPRFLEAVGDRRILAYNASFDASTIRITHDHAGRPGPLPPGDRWWCLMEALRIWRRVGRWSPLGGGHRALGDCRVAREVLMKMSAPVEAYR